MYYTIYFALRQTKRKIAALKKTAILCFLTAEVPDWCDCAGYDADDVMHDAVKHLKSLGHTKIGFIGETLTMSKYESFKNAVIGCGLEFNADYCRIENCRF